MPKFTLAMLEARVYDSLDANTGLYPEAQVRAVINQAVKKLNCIIGFCQDTIPVPGFSVAGQREYTAPTGIVIPIKIYFEGRILEPFSLRELATRFRKWATDTTANYGPVNRWAPIGLGMFVIHPTDVAGGNLIEVQGVAPVPLLTDLGQTIQLEDQWCDLLIDWIRSRIQLKEQGLPFQQSSMIYQDVIRKAKSMALFKGMKWPPYYAVSDAVQQKVGA